MKKNLIVALLLSIFLVGCNEVKQKVQIDNVKRIFLQSELDYILYIQAPGSTEVKILKLSSRYREKIKVITDVEQGQASWVEAVSVHSGGDTNYQWLEDITLHIHSLNEIQGGEYRTGGKNPQSFKNNLVE